MGGGGTHKVSSSVVWNRCCCWYCYSWRQTNTQSCQLRFLLHALLLLLLLYFGHHPISSTSSSIASSPTTDEARPITELQIGELQWIGFRYPLLGESRTVLDAARGPFVAAAACGAFALRRWRKKKRMKRLPSFTHLFPSFQNPISFSLVSREEDPKLSFISFSFFFPPRTRARHVGRPRNRGPESRALNNRGP